jgi:hypothetical protein
VLPGIELRPVELGWVEPRCVGLRLIELRLVELGAIELRGARSTSRMLACVTAARLELASAVLPCVVLPSAT